MLRTIALAVVLAIAVALGCHFLGGLLSTINEPISAFVGAFLRQYAVIIGILVGLWFAFCGYWHRDGPHL